MRAEVMGANSRPGSVNSMSYSLAIVLKKKEMTFRVTWVPCVENWPNKTEGAWVPGNEWKRAAPAGTPL